LAEISNICPINEKDLKKIKGIGEVKYNEFGNDILSITIKYK